MLWNKNKKPNLVNILMIGAVVLGMVSIGAPQVWAGWEPGQVGGEAESRGSATPEESFQSSDGLKQSIREFVADSGPDVTAEDVVGFLSGGMGQEAAAAEGDSDLNDPFGAERVFNEASTAETSVAALSSTNSWWPIEMSATLVTARRLSV